MSDRLLDAAEVAELLHVTKRWVADAAREGRFPSVQIGHYRRFRREAVIAWIGEHEVGVGRGPVSSSGRK